MFGKNNNICCFVLFAYFILGSKISFTSEMPEQDGHILRSCTRRFSTMPSVPSGDCLEHCYVQLIKGKRIVDSRGYFADTGSIEEPGMFDGFQTCLTVKKGLSLGDWRKITDVYDLAKAADYKAATHNCCSVAYEAIAAVVGKAQVPQNILTANSSIGTCHLRGSPLLPSA